MWKSGHYFAVVVFMIVTACAVGQTPLPPVVVKQNREPPEEGDYEAALIDAVHRFAESGETRNMHALLEKHPKLLNSKLKFHGPRKPKVGDRYTLLHRAVEHGKDEVVKLLVELKADLNADGGSGWTPLHLAAAKGRLEAVRVLVEGGAEVNASTTALPRAPLPGWSGIGPQTFSEAVPAYTPLDLVTGEKRDEIAELLKKKGAKPTNR